MRVTTILVFLAMEASASSGATCNDATGHFPNIEYLGQGYNMVLGNPQPWISNSAGSASGLAFDPGWRSASVQRGRTKAL